MGNLNTLWMQMRIGAAGPSFLPQTNAILGAMSPKPNSLHTAAINQFMNSLNDAALLPQIDVMYERAAAVAVNQSQVDWVLPTTDVLIDTAVPTFTADRYMTYNGSSQYSSGTSSGYTATFLNSVNVPTGPGSPAGGPGFTCTGLYKLASGNWLVGDHGFSSVPDTGTRVPAIVELSADFTTLIGSILTPNTSSIQGVCEDDAGRRYGAAPADNLIYQYDAAGNPLGNFTAVGANGLTWDTSTQCLVWLNSSGLVTWTRISNGTTLKTLSITGGSDQLFFDPTEGTAGVLYFSYGINGSVGHVCKMDVATKQYYGDWALKQAKAIEGLSYNKTLGLLYVVNDGRYHTSTGFTADVAQTYSVSPLGTSMSDRIIIAGVNRATSAPAATKTVFVGGVPVGGYGLGIFYPSGGTTFRLIMTTTVGSSVTVNWTSVTVTNRHMYWVDIDLTAKTATLYINGALVSSQAIASIGALWPKTSCMIANDFSLSRFCAMEFSSGMIGRGATLAAARTTWEAAQTTYDTAVGLTVP